MSLFGNIVHVVSSALMHLKILHFETNILKIFVVAAQSEAVLRGLRLTV